MRLHYFTVEVGSMRKLKAHRGRPGLDPVILNLVSGLVRATTI